MSCIRQAFVGAASLLCLSVANAAVVSTYDTLSAFNAAVGANTVTVEDFTSSHHFPISTGVLNSATNLPGIGITPGTIKAGVTYSTPVGSGNFFNIDAGGGFAGGFLDTVGGNNRVLTITFDGPTRYFAFESNSFAPSMTMNIRFAGGASSQQSIAPQNGSQMDFFGFGSDAADIQSLTLSGSGAISFAIDNFRFTTSDLGTRVAAVPEPGSLALVGLAAAGLVGVRRRKQR